jgi:hypothetical protein
LNKDSCTCECPVTTCADGEACSEVCSDFAVWNAASCECVIKQEHETTGEATYQNEWQPTYTNSKTCPATDIFWNSKKQSDCNSDSMPALKASTGECYCPVTLEICAAYPDKPYFNEAECGCTCPSEWKDACLSSNQNGCPVAEFEDATCSCKSINPTAGTAVFDSSLFASTTGFDFASWCSPHSNVFSEVSCPTNKPSYDPVTCSCYCKYDANTPAHLKAESHNFTVSSTCTLVPTANAAYCAATYADKPFYNPNTSECFCPFGQEACDADFAVFDGNTCSCAPNVDASSIELGTATLHLYQDEFVPSVMCMTCNDQNQWLLEEMFWPTGSEGPMSFTLPPNNQLVCSQDAEEILNAVGGCTADLQPTFMPLSGDCGCMLKSDASCA